MKGSQNWDRICHGLNVAPEGIGGLQRNLLAMDRMARDFKTRLKKKNRSMKNFFNWSAYSIANKIRTIVAVIWLAFILFASTLKSQTYSLEDNQFTYTVDSSFLMEYDQLRDQENTYLLIPKISPVWDSNGTISENTPVWDPTYRPIYEVTWMESYIAIRQDLVWLDLTIWFKKENTGRIRIIRIVNHGYDR